MNFANPRGAVSSVLHAGLRPIGGIENVTAAESGKLCALFLGPGLRLLNFNNLPVPIDPFIGKSIDPAKILYTEPRLAPGGEGPKPGTARDPARGVGLHRLAR